VTIAAETFSDLRARGVPLPVGTCVLTGSLSLPTPVRKGQTVTAAFAGLPQLALSLI
jgi:2-keto-4-pentenoate hydratase